MSEDGLEHAQNVRYSAYSGHQLGKGYGHPTDQGNVGVALHGVMAMVECELHDLEQAQKLGRPDSKRETTTRMKHDVWEQRAQELVNLAATEIGRTETICVRTACAHAVKRAMEGLSSEHEGQVRNC